MRKTIALAALLAGVLMTALPAAPARADVAVSFSFFHDTLSPYGRWVTVGSYGRCWYPAGVPAGWQPYTVGHWVYTDYGWTWVSADPWSEVTYRYGTWTFTPAYGWVWVPGFVWAPAWVTWSFTNDYIGWAPIPPTFSLTAYGYFGGPVVVSRSWYCFVPATRFVTTNVVNVRVPVRQNAVILAQSQRVTRFAVSGGVVRNQGPGPARIERVAKAPIRRVSSRQVGLQPVRVEAARTSGKRIAVIAPASAKRVAPQSGRAVSATDRPAPAAKARKATGKEKAKVSSKVSSSRAERAPAVQRAPEARQRPEASSKRAKPAGSTRPSQVGVSKGSRPPEAVSAPRASRPEKPERRALPSSSRGSERPQAVKAPAPRQSAAGQRGSTEKVKRAQPKKPPAKLRPEKREGKP
jgi:hypothetical protein